MKTLTKLLIFFLLILPIISEAISISSNVLVDPYLKPPKPVINSTLFNNTRLLHGIEDRWSSVARNGGISQIQYLGFDPLNKPPLKPLDKTIPGVQKVLKKTAKTRGPIKRGYLTELYYANGIYNDPRFQLIEMERLTVSKLGRSDADIVFRLKYGVFGKLEIKNVSMKTQELPDEMQRIKRQIDKMALDKKNTGAPQAFVNQQKVHPELIKHAARKGIPVYENVSRWELQDHLTKQVRAEQRSRAIKGGAGIGFGLLTMADSSPRLIDNMEKLITTDEYNEKLFRQIGLNSTEFMLGYTMTSTSGFHLTGQYVSEPSQAKLFRYARTGGIATIGLMALMEAQMINSYIEDDINSREFWTTQFVMAAAAGGGIAGTYLGGALGGAFSTTSSAGTLSSFGVTVGATGGGLAGTLLASNIASWLADFIYNEEYGELENRLDGYILKRNL